MAGKADKSTLETIHNATARMCLAILEGGEIVKDPETGEMRRVTPSASMLAVVTKFLKDNNITDDGKPTANAGRDLAAEARELPEFDSTEDGKHTPYN